MKQPDIPLKYRMCQDVFSKQLVTKLSPHRPWNCAVNLLPGATLPHSKVYPQSIPEQKAIEEYIGKGFKLEFSCTFTVLAASSFFFLGKKDGGLYTCIDYLALHLVSKALEQLCGARIFTKLDLRSSYNLVRIRKGDE